MLDLSATQGEYAIYTPALNTNYAQFPYREGTRLPRPLPAGLSMADFDILRAEDNSLFKMSHVLYSAGQSLEHQNDPCLVMNRDRNQSVVIGDSGGFQVIGGVLPPYTPTFVHEILRYLETMADVAMTADVPTRALLDSRKSGYHTFKECLDQSVANLVQFRNERENPNTRFLNVLQGRDYKEAQVWYEEVRKYKFEGWAFGGATRLDFHLVCKRLLEMIENGDLRPNSWLHFLGASFLEVSVVLTALKRALRNAGFTNLEISFDSASSLISGDKYKRATIGPKYGITQINIQRHQLPINRDGVDFDAPFPFDSPIGQRLKLGDFYDHTKPADTCFDIVGSAMLANHNIYKELASIIEVNRVVDIGARLHGTIPQEVQDAIGAMDSIFNDTGRSAHHLKVNRRALTHFVKLNEDDL